MRKEDLYPTKYTAWLKTMPGFPSWSPAVEEAYLMVFAQLTPEEAATAMNRVGFGSKRPDPDALFQPVAEAWSPTPTVDEAIAEIRHKADNAFVTVQARDRQTGETVNITREVRNPKWSHPLIGRALEDSVGWEGWRFAENPQIAYAQVRDAYLRLQTEWYRQVRQAVRQPESQRPRSLQPVPVDYIPPGRMAELRPDGQRMLTAPDPEEFAAKPLPPDDERERNRQRVRDLRNDLARRFAMEGPADKGRG